MEYKRLTFCLLGVATPSNLIADKNRTPFNIGRAITLTKFQLDEVESLIRGLEGIVARPKVILEEAQGFETWVVYFTNFKYAVTKATGLTPISTTAQRNLQHSTDELQAHGWRRVHQRRLMRRIASPKNYRLRHKGHQG